MDFNEALEAAERAISSSSSINREGLVEEERIVLEGAWNRQTYQQIATESGYAEGYLARNIGPALWDVLSQALGIQVRKTNFRTAIEAWVQENPPESEKSSEKRLNLVFKPETKTARYFTEPLSDDVGVDMIWIPGGEFDMGSADDDSEGYDDERPQHRVTVPDFFMGRYPVTQAQWRAVAALPQQNQELDPDPAYYKGDTRPVESVSWYDAVEFCDRLSQHTGRTYRLPSEAEWEYACRAHTTTPFYFGNQLTTDLANFDNSDKEGAAGTREGTTPIDTFPYANGFGLSDMHGNVLEWCLDHWHDNYEGAPTDGSAWLDKEADEEQSRVFRGGSWVSFPRVCRSACRITYGPRDSNFNFGFRVVCIAPRALT